MTGLQTMHQGIPTLYAGQQFRSRTEARWAAFFDALGWVWEYEPLDLHGYIPDFVLTFARPLLVEVKAHTTLDDLRTETWKLELSGWKHDALIVGAAPHFDVPAVGRHTLGVLSEREGPGREEWSWAPGILFACNACGGPSVYHSEGMWNCRAADCYDGNAHIEPLGSAQASWRKGANTVQWRRPE